MTAEQGRYQVRFDWGGDGARAVGSDAGVIVWVDELGSTKADATRLPKGVTVLEATIASASAVAQTIHALQQKSTSRLMVAVIAAGERRATGELRFAVEDLLAAGAVIDALCGLGIDATSPEAAAAEGAYLHLAGATRHLVSASVSATSRA